MDWIKRLLAPQVLYVEVVKIRNDRLQSDARLKCSEEERPAIVRLLRILANEIEEGK